MTSQYFGDFGVIYVCACGDLMTSQSGRGLVLICMERGLVNNGIALILGFFENLSRGSHEFFETPKFVG